MSNPNQSDEEFLDSFSIDDAYWLYRWNGNVPHLVGVEKLETILQEVRNEPKENNVSQFRES